MKKSFIIIFLLAMGSTLLFAQESPRFGLRAGLSYTNNILTNTDKTAFDNKYRFSYHFGLTGEFTIADHISIAPELLYSSKGYYSEGSIDTTPSGDSKTHYNYLTAPIFLNFKPIDELRFGIGTEIAYLLSAKSKFDSEDIDLLNWWSNDQDWEVNRLEFALAGGMSIDITRELSVGARYFHGLTGILDPIQITNELGQPTGKEGKNVNRTFQLSFAYLIN
jgi:opacity protein-like surface antigen